MDRIRLDCTNLMADVVGPGRLQDVHEVHHGAVGELVVTLDQHLHRRVGREQLAGLLGDALE